MCSYSTVKASKTLFESGLLISIWLEMFMQYDISVSENSITLSYLKNMYNDFLTDFEMC